MSAAGQQNGKAPLSVVVTTFNEGANVETCLRSARWADEILVIDSGSTDGTVEAAERMGGRVLQHAYESPARQKNWAIPHNLCIVSSSNLYISRLY